MYENSIPPFLEIRNQDYENFMNQKNEPKLKPKLKN
jgi:hypothetical protein